MSNILHYYLEKQPIPNRALENDQYKKKAQPLPLGVMTGICGFNWSIYFPCPRYFFLRPLREVALRSVRGERP